MNFMVLSPFFISAGYDYNKSANTLIFEPSNETRSQQQCLNIKIINDSLPEDWEVFTLLLSTNNSAVNLSINRVDVYIIDGKFRYLATCMAL